MFTRVLPPSAESREACAVSRLDESATDVWLARRGDRVRLEIVEPCVRAVIGSPEAGSFLGGGLVVALDRIDDLAGDFFGLPAVPVGVQGAEAGGLRADVPGQHGGDQGDGGPEGAHLVLGEFQFEAARQCRHNPQIIGILSAV